MQAIDFDAGTSPTDPTVWRDVYPDITDFVTTAPAIEGAGGKEGATVWVWSGDATVFDVNELVPTGKQAFVADSSVNACRYVLNVRYPLAVCQTIQIKMNVTHDLLIDGIAFQNIEVDIISSNRSITGSMRHFLIFINLRINNPVVQPLD